MNMWVILLPTIVGCVLATLLLIEEPIMAWVKAYRLNRSCKRLWGMTLAEWEIMAQEEAEERRERYDMEDEEAGYTI